MSKHDQAVSLLHRFSSVPLRSPRSSATRELDAAPARLTQSVRHPIHSTASATFDESVQRPYAWTGAAADAARSLQSETETSLRLVPVDPMQRPTTDEGPLVTQSAERSPWSGARSALPDRHSSRLRPPAPSPSLKLSTPSLRLVHDRSRAAITHSSDRWGRPPLHEAETALRGSSPLERAVTARASGIPAATRTVDLWGRQPPSIRAGTATAWPGVGATSRGDSDSVLWASFDDDLRCNRDSRGGEF